MIAFCEAVLPFGDRQAAAEMARWALQSRAFHQEE